MKYVDRKVEKATVAEVYEFDVFDAIEASQALDELEKACQDSIDVDDEGTPHQYPVAIDTVLANKLCTLLSKIAAPVHNSRRTGNVGIFDNLSEEVVTKGAE